MYPFPYLFLSSFKTPGKEKSPSYQMTQSHSTVSSIVLQRIPKKHAGHIKT